MLIKFSALFYEYQIEILNTIIPSKIYGHTKSFFLCWLSRGCIVSC